MKKDFVPGCILSVVLTVEFIVLFLQVSSTGMLPPAYLAAVGLVLVLLDVLAWFLASRFHKKLRFACGILVFVICTAVSAVGISYIQKGIQTYEKVSETVKTDTARVVVYGKRDTASDTNSQEETAATEAEDVLEPESAAILVKNAIASHMSGEVPVSDTLEEGQQYSVLVYGILKDMDRENTDLAIAEMEADTGEKIRTVEYGSLTELADGLLNDEVDAVILNEVYMSMLMDMDGYQDIETKVEEIDAKAIEISNVEETSGTSSEKEAKDGDIESAKDVAPFLLFISGIDTRGEMTARSLSDVNILAAINPQSHQFLMVSTPRDYYVPLSISNGVPDKLTHAGIYGIEVCVDTQEMLYGEEIDYYFRVNFGGFQEIIDALGGIHVISDYTFDSQNMPGYSFVEGDNYMTGASALAFCRERYSFASGDRQRGKNQMAVVRGVAEKILSVDFLRNYASVLDAVEGSFETDMPFDVLAALGRNQLQDNQPWDIVTYSVDGTGDSQMPYSMKQYAYVMQPDYSTVDHAKEMIQQVLKGEKIEQMTEE